MESASFAVGEDIKRKIARKAVRGEGAAAGVAAEVEIGLEEGIEEKERVLPDIAEVDLAAVTVIVRDVEVIQEIEEEGDQGHLLQGEIVTRIAEDEMPIEMALTLHEEEVKNYN